MILSIVVFILILGLLVLIHEFGHFIVAKKSGVRVEEFAIGFPPRLFGIKRGETLYSINALPIGGYVRLYGEEYNELKEGAPRDPRAFVHKKPWQKAAVVAAGVIMNLLLGVIIYSGLLMQNGFMSEPIPLIFKHTFTFGSAQGRVIASHLVPGSPAQKAGLKVEDSIVAYKLPSGTQQWTVLNSAEQVISVIKQSANTPITLLVENIRTGGTTQITVTPRYDQSLKRAIIGVSMVDGVVLSYRNTPLLAGAMHSYNMMGYNFSAIAQLVSLSFKEKSAAPVSSAVAGPIGIYSVVNDVLHSSGERTVHNLLNIMALLSLSLGFMNILPFPALDGGRMVFVIYEWITKRPVNKRVESYTNLIGFSLLMVLAVVVSFNDILRILR